jgi:hypothetical protein
VEDILWIVLALDLLEHGKVVAELFRDLGEDETQRETVPGSLKDDCEVRTGRPAGL